MKGPVLRFLGQAAGLALEKKNLESFKEKLQNVASQKLTEENLIPQLNIDCEVNLDEINQELVTYLEQMAPFGPGNMRPVLVTKNLGNFAQPSVVGNNHLKLRINQNNRPVICDSARKDKIFELQMSGINAIGSTKGEGSILDGIERMQEFSIFVHKNSENVKREFKTYRWAEDKVTGKALNEPEDTNNHAIDSCRYSIRFYRRNIKPL